MTTTAVRVMDEGGYIVRGTTDEATARGALQDYLAKGGGHTEDEAAEWVPLIDVVRVGLFRWNPCNERNCWDGGIHCGHLAYVDQRGPGVWEGVYLV